MTLRNLAHYTFAIIYGMQAKSLIHLVGCSVVPQKIRSCLKLKSHKIVRRGKMDRGSNLLEPIKVLWHSFKLDKNKFYRRLELLKDRYFQASF